MLTKDQAQAASSALLQPEQSRQAAHAALLARQQRVQAKRKWRAAGALFGLAIGSSIGAGLPGHPFAPSIIGFLAGAVAGVVAGRLRA